MKVKYKAGVKGKVPVLFPIGVKNKSGVHETKWADPYLEMSEEDAHKLVALDSYNFELVLDESNQPLSALGEIVKRGPGRPKKLEADIVGQ